MIFRKMALIFMIAAVVLCNTANTVVPDYLMRNIMDILLGRDPVIPVKVNR